MKIRPARAQSAYIRPIAESSSNIGGGCRSLSFRLSGYLPDLTFASVSILVREDDATDRSTRMIRSNGPAWSDKQ